MVHLDAAEVARSTGEALLDAERVLERCKAGSSDQYERRCEADGQQSAHNSAA